MRKKITGFRADVLLRLTADVLLRLTIALALGLYAQATVAVAQAQSNGSGSRTVEDGGAKSTAEGKPTSARQLDASNPADSSEEAAIQAQINSVYQNFYNTYRLGAGDAIAIYVDRHPKDSVERTVVSPFGQVYYPLMGNVNVAGKTLAQIQEFFTTAISEFIRSPRVTISLIEANSAKIGVLGDVRNPGVIIMNRPMRVLDALAATGGITERGNSSKVSVLRQYEDGSVKTFTVNVKNILKGKADPEENTFLRAGDTIIVHGNLFKKIERVSSLLGVTSFISFVTNTGR